MRDPVHLDFDRDRDLLLDFLGGEAGDLGGDLSGDRAEKRVGVDRQLRPRIDAKNCREDRNKPNDETFAKAEGDELVNH